MKEYIRKHIHILIAGWCTLFTLLLHLLLTIPKTLSVSVHVVEGICYLILFAFVLVLCGNRKKTKPFYLISALGMLMTITLLFTYNRPQHFANYPAYPIQKELSAKTIFQFPTITNQYEHTMTVQDRNNKKTINLSEGNKYILVYNPVCPICQDSTKLFTLTSDNTDKINVNDYQIIVANTIIDTITKPLIEKYNVSEIPSIIHLRNGKLVDVLPLYNEQTNQFVTTTQLKQWLQQ
jgi:hypothetical protein